MYLNPAKLENATKLKAETLYSRILERIRECEMSPKPAYNKLEDLIDKFLPKCIYDSRPAKYKVGHYNVARDHIMLKIELPLTQIWEIFIFFHEVAHMSGQRSRLHRISLIYYSELKYLEESVADTAAIMVLIQLGFVDHKWFTNQLKIHLNLVKSSPLTNDHIEQILMEGGRAANWILTVKEVK